MFSENSEWLPTSQTWEHPLVDIPMHAPVPVHHQEEMSPCLPFLFASFIVNKRVKTDSLTMTAAPLDNDVSLKGPFCRIPNVGVC